VVERVEGERLFGRPPAVDGGLADAGPFGDRVHADRSETACEEKLRGRGEDRLAGLLTKLNRQFR
jgi:hypothetical protein